MEYVEYAVVGLLVLAATAYAALRVRRALQGRGGCSFMSGGGDSSPCAHCPGVCSRTREEEDDNNNGGAQTPSTGPR